MNNNNNNNNIKNDTVITLLHAGAALPLPAARPVAFGLKGGLKGGFKPLFKGGFKGGFKPPFEISLAQAPSTETPAERKRASSGPPSRDKILRFGGLPLREKVPDIYIYIYIYIYTY